MDTYQASVCIASRGMYCTEDYQSYLKGIRSLAGHIYSLVILQKWRLHMLRV